MLLSAIHRQPGKSSVLWHSRFKYIEDELRMSLFRFFVTARRPLIFL